MTTQVNLLAHSPLTFNNNTNSTDEITLHQVGQGDVTLPVGKVCDAEKLTKGE